VHDPVGKILAFVIGVGLVAGFGWLGLDSLSDYRAFGDAATRTGLVGAVEASNVGRQWVTIEGAPWRCDQALRNVDGGAVFLPATAEDGSLVVARFDREIACPSVAARALTGVIEPMAPDRANNLRAAGLRVPEGARLRTFDVCSFCGKSNARLGVILCSCFVALGLALYPLRVAFLRLRRRAFGALDDAIHAPADRGAPADRFVRLWGAAVLAGGIGAFALGGGYVLWGIIPLPWFGAVATLLGGYMVAFPERYRRIAKRGRASPR
jgi:hypothetical protein